MIPQIIHYCWFGKTPKPKLVKNCIKSWRKHLSPEWKIIEWNEGNFNILECPQYVQQAYKEKKWAFVTDYVRFKVIYDVGGIYLDTDVKLLKPLDFLIHNAAFFGAESNEYIASGLGFGAERGHEICKAMMSSFVGLSFYNDDGSFNELACPYRETEIIKKYGFDPIKFADGDIQYLDGEVVVFSPKYMTPTYSVFNLHHKDAFSIHLYSASWYSKEDKKKKKKRLIRIRLILLPKIIGRAILGNKLYSTIKKWV